MEAGVGVKGRNGRPSGRKAERRGRADRGGKTPYLQSGHCMKHVKKSVLLWYSPHEMYRLVTDIARYPEFLPWCERADILEHRDEGVTAKLSLAYAGVRHAFTTRNAHEAD